MSGTILVGRYKIQAALGSGSYGSVYRGLDKKTGNAVAVKLQNKCDQRWNNFEQEVKIYTALRGVPGFPALHWKGKTVTGRQALVLDLLGPDLGKLLLCPASLKTTLMIALQLLTRLEDLHRQGFIHNDLKLENVLVGSQNQSILYLADFGISIQHMYKGSFPTKQRANAGSYIFSAIGTHKRDFRRGIACPQHDLEALGYMMVYLLKGSLPWKDLCFLHTVDDAAVMKVKLAHRASLCNSMPQELRRYMRYVHALKCEESVDYAYLRDLLQQLLDRSGLQNDGVFDWTPTVAALPRVLLPPVTPRNLPVKVMEDCLPRDYVPVPCVQDTALPAVVSPAPEPVEAPCVPLRRCVSARRHLKDKLARATELNRADLVRSQSANAITATVLPPIFSVREGETLALLVCD
jgi:serine/threonine protein kinase